MLKIVVLVGNPKPTSRTMRVAQSLVTHLMEDRPHNVQTIDLAEHAEALFKWPSDVMSEFSSSVAAADLLVVASPTYKGTYTGMLKSFLDRFPADALHGSVAIPVMTGADRAHSLAPDIGLRPLLVELGARVPTQSFYFVTSDINRLDELAASWVNANESSVGRLSRLAARPDGMVSARTTAQKKQAATR